ncbi:pectate lyase [Caldalkalibacillus salinus]|uniref:pectate lyase n=1 Tax=Caldalkalibacillus salinus TaxID=2803787 RepID=UPI0019240985|nr:pectate lyase [Caldalkalibacillus salinus]
MGSTIKRHTLTTTIFVMFAILFAVTVSAEDGIYHADEAWGEGYILNNDHQGFIGDHYIQFTPNVPGGFAEWDVTIENEGMYTLVIRYAHGGGANRPGDISVNGEVVEEDLAFLPTGAWNQWDSASTVAHLDEGTNTVRFTGVGPEGGPNLDHLQVIEGIVEEDDGVAEYDVTDISDRLQEPLFQKWQEEGFILESVSFNPHEPIKRIEFFALINRLFDFTNDGAYQGVSEKPFLSEWNIPEDAWYSFVIQAAHQAGYLSQLDREQIQPEKSVTMEEAALILKDVLDLNAIDEAKDYFKTTDRPNKPLTHEEASDLSAFLQQETDSVSIASVDALGPQTIAVTLNSYFEDVSPQDIRVTFASGPWNRLNPGLRDFTIKEASIGVNRLGLTVIVYDIAEMLDDNAQYGVEEEKTEIEYDQSTVDAAENLLTWQLEHGGWTKNFPHIYTRPWDGEEPRSEWVHNGQELGTIDNDATINEIRTVAEAYVMTGDPRFKESVEKGFEFIDKLQYPTGGFAQVYPSRGGYSDYVTFNDAAMTNVLEFYDEVIQREGAFQSTDLISDAFITELEEAVDLALDYILTAQIEVDGVLTGWGQQHDPVTYEPRHGRSYEHPSISADESIPVIRWLMARPDQTEDIQRAVESAIQYFDSVRIDDTRFDNRVEPYFIHHPGSTVWYRFYEIGTNNPIFSGRDGVIKYDISEIEEERRTGYAWAGTWPHSIIEIAKTTGYYVNNVYGTVHNDRSTDVHGRQLNLDSMKKVTNRID